MVLSLHALNREIPLTAGEEKEENPAAAYPFHTVTQLLASQVINVVHEVAQNKLFPIHVLVLVNG